MISMKLFYEKIKNNHGVPYIRAYPVPVQGHNKDNPFTDSIFPQPAT